MLKELLTLLPDATTRIPTPVAIAAAVVAVGLWLVGGLYSRAIVTLAMVAVGAMIGVRLPRWLGWSIDGAAVGVTAAIVLGSTAYFLHRAWVGALFGTVLAFWAAAAVWIAMAPVVTWHWPQLQWTGDASELLAQVWQALPEDLRTITPVASACGMVAGVAIALLWPRLSRALLFSVLGVSVAVVVGGPVLVRTRPELLDLLPSRTSSQAVGLLALVVIGTLVQWWLVQDDEPAAAAAKDKTEPKRAKVRPKKTVRVKEAAPTAQPDVPLGPADDEAGDEGSAVARESATDDPLDEPGSPAPPGAGAAATKVSA